jgi:L-malate glycosyltransferase
VTFHGLEEGRVVSHRLDAQWSRADVTALAARVVSVAAAERLEVLHVHYAMPFARVAAEVRRLDGHSPRLVATLHGTDVSVHGAHPRTGPALARALEGVDALTTVSRSHARLSVETLKLSFEPVVIPNFVNVERFRPTDRGRANGHRPVVIHVSNFRRVKDPEAVARVFGRVRREVDAELWLVGDGEMMAAVRARLVGAGLEGHVRRFGLHDHVEEILPHAQVLLLTSRAESFCLAALEAAACGVPVVAPRVGGVPEVVADGETGELFEPGDEEAAAGLVVRLLRDPFRRSAMAVAAVRRARRFGGEVVVPRYEALYRRVLAERVAGPRPGRPEG